MTGFGDSLQLAFGLILSGDADLWAIVFLSLKVSLTAVALAGLIGMPLGALLAVTRFRGRGALIVTVNALMGLPPVVVGLAMANASPGGTPVQTGRLYAMLALQSAAELLVLVPLSALLISNY